MDEVVKTKWVAALRSGEYQQGRGYLNRTDDEGTKYCCLGVLCEIARAEGLELDVHFADDGHSGTTYYDGYSTVLPDAVEEWAGLTVSNPEVVYDYTLRKRSLAELNDGRQDSGVVTREPYDFNQIADVIERSL